MADTMLQVEHITKAYRLGQYSGATFRKELMDAMLHRSRREKDEKDIFYALRDVNLEVERGQALGIIGRNGAGKSTLLKIISRITAPTEGMIRIAGKVASLLEIGTGFHGELTGRENIYLNGAIMGMTRAETTLHMKDILEFSEIEKFIDTPVKRYSSGMTVKLGFAVAANLDPDLLICDEVLAVGDTAYQQKCLKKMSDVAESGSSVLYVSHNMRTVEQLCNRVVCLDHGSVVFDGLPEDGIRKYVGEHEGETDAAWIVQNREPGMGEHARLEGIKLESAMDDGYNMDSDVMTEIAIWTDGEYPELRLHGCWLTADFPVGASDSEKLALPMGTHRIRMKLPLSRMSTGEYSLKLQILGSRKGNMQLLDSVKQACSIKIQEDRSKNLGVYWTSHYWGNMRIESVDVRKV